MYKLTDEQREMWEAFSIDGKIGLLAQLYYSGSYGGSSSYKTQMADALLAISRCHDWPVRDERQIMLVQAMATKQEALQVKDDALAALVTAWQNLCQHKGTHEQIVACAADIGDAPCECGYHDKLAQMELAIKEATDD